LYCGIQPALPKLIQVGAKYEFGSSGGKKHRPHGFVASGAKMHGSAPIKYVSLPLHGSGLTTL
jgi:hypothetical protein